MEDKLHGLLDKIRKLEHELILEIQKKEKEFYYEIRRTRVFFEREIKRQHKHLIKRIPRYLREAAVLNILTAPVIWSCLIPALLMDLVISAYQAVCFPLYSIPKVRRSDYIILDRRYLSYLNFIEKMNCVYCGYFNGVMGYAQEVGARTEQYWCPIKHARKLKFVHGRYKNFLDYGDGVGYREKIEQVRRGFDDLPRDGEG